MSPSPLHTPGRTTPSPWRRWLRWPGLLGLAATLAGLALAPATTLRLFWGVVVPLLPATFLLSPSLWRATCPLATLGLAAEPERPGRSLDPGAGRVAAHAGIAALLLLIPLRRVTLEFHAGAVAFLLGCFALAAVLLARGHRVKAGFCNAVCPILPVERLYGFRPLVNLAATRCGPCVRCTSAGCLDRSPHEGLVALGEDLPDGQPWLRTVPGLFVAGFPGVIVGFGLLPDPGPVSLGRAYGQVIMGLVLSWALVAAVTARLRPTTPGLIAALAPVCAAAFYWFAAPHMAAALGLGSAVGAGLRAAFLCLVAAWTLAPRASLSRGA